MYALLPQTTATSGGCLSGRRNSAGGFPVKAIAVGRPCSPWFLSGATGTFRVAIDFPRETGFWHAIAVRITAVCYGGYGFPPMARFVSFRPAGPLPCCIWKEKDAPTIAAV